MKKRGFILYIVVCILLGLAILAFALNDFKRGAVTQLAKNVDQNRLMLLAKSANNEVMALIRSQVNLSPNSSIFQKFRSGFPANAGNSSPLNREVQILSGFKPEQTLEMADDSGYTIDIECRANLTYYSQASYKSVSAYNAYLDIYSHAWRKDAPKNSIEVYERHDVRLVDMRHNLDKYALFVKNYSPDLNNTQRRVVVQGIEPTDGLISRVYLGNDNYPDKEDPSNDLWLDICFDEIKDMPGFKAIFGAVATKPFADGSGEPNMFYSNAVPFTDLNLPKNLFYQVTAVKKVYEDFVNKAANGCAGKTDLPAKVGQELKAKCQECMPHTNNNAAAYRICNDYVTHFKRSTIEGKEVDDYSECENFNSILETCMQHWVYQYGYLDANKVWDVVNCERPDVPKTLAWDNCLAFKGLVEPSDDYGKVGPYIYAYSFGNTANGKVYNPERYRVGKMLRLYGYENKTPVLVEGPVKMRFYKIGFFNDFEQTLTFYTMNHAIHPETVPILFRRHDLPETFQNIETCKDFAATDYFSDKKLMSQAIDNVSVNALLLGGQDIGYYNGDGELKKLSREDVYNDSFLYPCQKTAETKVKATNMGRLVDFSNSSYNYPSPTEFMADRVRTDESGKKVLFIDGVMYIQQGEMDLSDVNYFYGKGLIYLGTGNLTLGNFRRFRDMDSGDSCRFYLRQGDIKLGSSESDITIEASLAAIFSEVGSSDPQKQGSLILSNKRNVTIFGNLLVDYFYTQDKSGNGLQAGGQLVIEHDPLILEPAVTTSSGKMDPYHVSIGRIKTAYAVKAAEAGE